MGVEEQRRKMEEMKADGWVFPNDWEPFSDSEIELAVKKGLTGTTNGVVYFPTGEVVSIALPIYPDMRIDLLQRLFDGYYSAHFLHEYDSSYDEKIVFSYNDDIAYEYWAEKKHPKDSGFQLNENVPELPKEFIEYLIATDDGVYFEWTGKNKDRPPLGGFWGPVVLWHYPN